MDPQDFLRLSIGSLGLKIPTTASKPTKKANSCHCEVRLRGFPIQTAPIPIVLSSDFNPESQSNPVVFYLEKSNIKAYLTSNCFQAPQPFLEVVVYTGKSKNSPNCNVTGMKKKIGSFKMEVGPEWSEGKPQLIHNGWIQIGKNQQELHLRVKLDLDPRYVFQFEDETASSPQIVQLQGSIRQPIFSCKFSRDRRSCQPDGLSNYWSNYNSEVQDSSQRERKGWKVVIHDLSGSAAAAAFMATPFVPSTTHNIVSKSNPGSWLIVRPDHAGPTDSWHPWGRLEAWRDSGPHDSLCMRLFLLPQGQESGVLVSEVVIGVDKGGDFCIDTIDEFGNLGCDGGGFVMSCKVKGEGKCSKPVVQLAMRHVTCVEDAAIFMALAAAVDLSVEACRPFRRKGMMRIKDSLML